MKKVVICTTPSCNFCKKTKEFEEKDVTSDEVAKKEFMDKIDGAVPSVPLVLINLD